MMYFFHKYKFPFTKRDYISTMKFYNNKNSLLFCEETSELNEIQLFGNSNPRCYRYMFDKRLTYFMIMVIVPKHQQNQCCKGLFSSVLTCDIFYRDVKGK